MWYLRRSCGSLLIALLVSLLFAGLGLLSSVADAQTGTVKLEWFGWSFFRFTSPTGKVILTNPFITGNQDAAVTLDEITKADLILVPNGHRDEIGDTSAIAKKTGAKIVSPFELGTWFISKGVPEAQVLRRNPGSRLVWEGITIRVVGSVHGSGSGQGTDSDVAPIYGGAAAGFMITFENGWTVYFPGSSAATQDMALWGAAYKPDAMIFLMHPTGEPRDIGMAVKLVMTDNPNLKTLLPHHHRVTPPAGAPTVADVRAVLDSMNIRIPITDPVRKQVYEFTK
jgi:L-ascorbate metabolism protein UlaG (beta-lactamase superfamily)